MLFAVTENKCIFANKKIRLSNKYIADDSELYLDRFFADCICGSLCTIAVFWQCTGFSDIVNSTFDSAKNGFEISLGLTGVLALWMGIMKIGERGGVINAFAFGSTIFCAHFPDIPKDHPAMGTMFMNIAANYAGARQRCHPPWD